MVEFMQQGTTIMPEVYFEALKRRIAKGHSEQKARNAWFSMTMRARIQLLALEPC
jgi:hypothetical protein